jgi:hypothetical protein
VQVKQPEIEEAGGDVSRLFEADGAVEVTLPSGKKLLVRSVCALFLCVTRLTRLFQAVSHPSCCLRTKTV